MRAPALAAIFMPWVLLAVAIFAQYVDQPDAVERMSLLWIGYSPVFTALVILVSYREGQLSKK
jgi:hypothetical protein